MEIYFDKTYKLKNGAQPVTGYADYGTDYLKVISVDTDEKTVIVYPEGFNPSSRFEANINDLIEQR